MDKKARERESLIRRGFDGLYHPNPGMACGCYVDDLYPCGERPKECRPGHVSECDDVIGVFGPAGSPRMPCQRAPARSHRHP